MSIFHASSMRSESALLAKKTSFQRKLSRKRKAELAQEALDLAEGCDLRLDTWDQLLRRLGRIETFLGETEDMPWEVRQAKERDFFKAVLKRDTTVHDLLAQAGTQVDQLLRQSWLHNPRNTADPDSYQVIQNEGLYFVAPDSDGLGIQAGSGTGLKRGKPHPERMDWILKFLREKGIGPDGLIIRPGGVRRNWMRQTPYYIIDVLALRDDSDPSLPVEKRPYAQIVVCPETNNITYVTRKNKDPAFWSSFGKPQLDRMKPDIQRVECYNETQYVQDLSDRLSVKNPLAWRKQPALVQAVADEKMDRAKNPRALTEALIWAAQLEYLRLSIEKGEPQWMNQKSEFCPPPLQAEKPRNLDNYLFKGQRKLPGKDTLNRLTQRYIGRAFHEWVKDNPDKKGPPPYDESFCGHPDIKWGHVAAAIVGWKQRLSLGTLWRDHVDSTFPVEQFEALRLWDDLLHHAAIHGDFPDIATEKVSLRYAAPVTGKSINHALNGGVNLPQHTSISAFAQTMSLSEGTMWKEQNPGRSYPRDDESLPRHPGVPFGILDRYLRDSQYTTLAKTWHDAGVFDIDPVYLEKQRLFNASIVHIVFTAESGRSFLPSHASDLLLRWSSIQQRFYTNGFGVYKAMGSLHQFDQEMIPALMDSYAAIHNGALPGPGSGRVFTDAEAGKLDTLWPWHLSAKEQPDAAIREKMFGVYWAKTQLTWDMVAEAVHNRYGKPLDEFYHRAKSGQVMKPLHGKRAEGKIPAL